MQVVVRHGVEIDVKPELVFSEELRCVHVAFVSVPVKVPFDFFPRIPGLEPLGLNVVRHPVDGDLPIGDVGVEKLFRVPCTPDVRLGEEHQDSGSGSSGGGR